MIRRLAGETRRVGRGKLSGPRDLFQHSLDVVPELAGAAPETIDGRRTGLVIAHEPAAAAARATRVSIGDAEANDVFPAVARVGLYCR